MTDNTVKSIRSGLWIWLPVLASVVVFSPGLSGQFVWDDEILIQDNERIHDIRNFVAQLSVDFWDSSVPAIHASGLYRPIVKAFYLLEYQLFRGRPIGFLAVNLLLHLGCVVLAFRFLRRRLQGDSGVGLIAASVAALLFALHPAKAESVSWISGSTDLWMTFFVLCGFELWEGRDQAIYVALAAVSFLCAFLCKETALGVPVILASDAWLLTPRERRKIDLSRVGVVLLALGLGVYLHVHFVANRYVPGTDWSPLRLVERVTASFGLYLERATWPWVATTQAGALSVDQASRFLIPGIHVGIGLLGALALVALLGLAILKPGLRQLASLSLHFAVPLGPVVNILPLEYRYLTADRFLYWPTLGLVAAGAWCAARAVTTRSTRILTLATFIVLGVGWSVVTASHVLHFHSNFDLWSYEYQLNPENQFVAETLARTLWAQDKAGAAMPVAERAISLSKTPVELSRSAALYATILLETASDGDQRRLLSAREFLDQIADDRATVVTLHDGQVNVSVVPTPEVRRRIREGRGFDVQRAIAHLRTDDWEGADAQFMSILSKKTAQLPAWLNAIQVQAVREKWETADRLLAEAKSRFGANETLARTEAKIRQSRRRISDAGSREPGRSLAEAEVLLDLGVPRRAQQIVSALQERYPSDSQISGTQARIETAIRGSAH